MFLIQHFCCYGILPFSKSYPEIESLGPTAKCRGRNFFGTWYYIVQLCVSFSSKWKVTHVFLKNIRKSKARDQWIQARKKLFYHVVVNNYLWNVSCEFLVKIEGTWRHEIKEQTPSWLYCTMVGLSEAGTGGVLSESCS